MKIILTLHFGLELAKYYKFIKNLLCILRDVPMKPNKKYK